MCQTHGVGESRGIVVDISLEGSIHAGLSVTEEITCQGEHGAVRSARESNSRNELHCFLAAACG